MELQGELSDFPLADILQIICLSKKTGTLLVTGGERRGMIVFVRGKIVQAITDASPNSLGDLLVEREVIGPFELEQALRLQARSQPPRLLGSLLVELGFVERFILNQRVREQIQHSIGGLVGLRRGSFELKLNVVPIGRSQPYPSQDFVLTEGADVEELLLEVATALDEAHRDSERNGVSTGSMPKLTTGSLLGFEELGRELFVDFTAFLDGHINEDPEHLLSRLDPGSPSSRSDAREEVVTLTEHERFLRFQAFLRELKYQSAHPEVALTIMRFAAEVASRGVLFVVRDREIAGQGQFGVQQLNGSLPSLADRQVREIKIALEEPSLVTDAARTATTRVGRLVRTPATIRILEKIGAAENELIAAAIPMICLGSVRLVLYIDNFPGTSEFRGLPELEVLVDQAGLVMEKIILEQRLHERDLGNGNH